MLRSHDRTGVFSGVSSAPASPQAATLHRCWGHAVNAELDTSFADSYAEGVWNYI